MNEFLSLRELTSEIVICDMTVKAYAATGSQRAVRMSDRAILS